MSVRVAVVGGGIAGLSCAYELAKAGVPFTLLEAGERLGGVILTSRLAGGVLEVGPDSFVTNKPWALELVRELGLEGELLPTSNRDKSVFVFSRGRLRRFPDGLMLMAPTKTLPFLRSDIVSFAAKIRMGWELFVPKRTGRGDESMADFARRRFGNEALDVIIGPILAGIFAGDPERLSMLSTFPHLCRLESEHGSLIRAMRRMAGRRNPDPKVTLFMTLRGGLSRLTEALAERLPKEALRLGAAVESIKKSASGYAIQLAGRECIQAERVVLAVPADRAALLVGGLDAELASELGAIQFSSTAVVSLAYDAGDLAGAPRGFGFVVDRREALTVLAATFSSTKFPGRSAPGSVLIRCFIGGAGQEDALKADDAGLIAVVRGDLKRVLALTAAPRETRVHRWNGANPQYNVGHSERLERIAARVAALEGLVLAGSSYRGVGIPDCVRSGREAGRRLAAEATAVV